jgi:hypothetical protein
LILLISNMKSKDAIHPRLKSLGLPAISYNYY